MSLTVKDFLFYSWLFPFEHLYVDKDCTIVRYEGSRGTCYNLVYRDNQASNGFTMVPFYYVNEEAMQRIIDDSKGQLSNGCTNFLYGMLG